MSIKDNLKESLKEDFDFRGIKEDLKSIRNLKDLEILDKDNQEPRPEGIELQTEIKPISNVKSVLMTLAIGLISFIFYLCLPQDWNLEKFSNVGINKGLALLLFVALMWLTETVHITITALFVPILAVILKIPNKEGTAISLKQSLAGFADPTIYIFFGGFALAAALHMQKLDKKIAGFTLSLARGNMFYAALLIMFATSLLSMWISNTATAAMMLPLAIGMMGSLDQEKDHKTFVFVLLGIAYAASIGGLGTLVGSPPNNIAARALEMDFAAWFKIGFPLVLILMPVMVLTLYLLLRPNFKNAMGKTEKEETIEWTYHRIVAACIFLVTAFSWIFSSQISAATGIKSLDSVIALTAAISVGVFGVASWKEISANTDWGVLLMFGGGLSLSFVLDASGASAALGNTVAAALKGTSFIVIVFAVAAFIIFLTEFTSNTASAALLVPVFGTIAAQMGMPKELLVLIIGLGASCAFMMPVATPPNAIVFGSGHIKQKEMVSIGFVLNLISIAIVGGFILLVSG